MTFASDHNFNIYGNKRSIKELELNKEGRNSRMCDNTIVLFVSWSNEQWHAWILIAYFHVNVNSHFLAAFCQQINIFSYLQQSKGNILHFPVSNGVKIGPSQS